MKPLLLTIALLFSTPAWAEWEFLHSQEGSELYIDYTNIRKKDEYLYFWLLFSWQKPFDDGSQSIQVYHKYDCDLGGQKQLQMFHYSQPMGRGVVIKDESFTTNEEKWYYPPQDSTYTKLIKNICIAEDIIKK